MTKIPTIFKTADPWVLLTIIYAGKKKGANLVSIISVGDYINRCIYSWQELQGGLYRLLKAGYITEEDGGYRPTEKIMVPFTKKFKNRVSFMKQMDFLRDELKSPKWSEDYKPATANEGVVYKKITEAGVEAAYNEYRKEIEKLMPADRKKNSKERSQK